MHRARVAEEVAPRPRMSGKELVRRLVTLQAIAARAGGHEVARLVGTTASERMHVVEGGGVRRQGRRAVDAALAALAQGHGTQRTFALGTVARTERAGNERERPTWGGHRPPGATGRMASNHLAPPYERGARLVKRRAPRAMPRLRHAGTPRAVVPIRELSAIRCPSDCAAPHRCAPPSRRADAGSASPSRGTAAARRSHRPRAAESGGCDSGTRSAPPPRRS